MKMTFDQLRLHCRQSIEVVSFGERLSFFYGEMSSGKSSIAELIDYCLGGSLVRTPAITSELISVELAGTVGDTRILIHRSLQARASAEVSWERGDDMGQGEFPLQAGASAVYSEDVFSFSDFVMRLLGLPVLKVRKSKRDPDSPLWRVSIRDFFEFCYLDQRNLDSGFFLLEQPVRAEKSKDVLRFILGLHSERLLSLEGEISQLRQEQRLQRETASQITQFLARYGFESEEGIVHEIAQLERKQSELTQRAEAESPSKPSLTTVEEEDRRTIRQLFDEIESKADAVNEISVRIREQEALAAEFLAMKFKVARVTRASELLGEASFEACPLCGTGVTPPHDPERCTLCKSPLAGSPGRVEFEVPVIERDLTDRVEDLKVSVGRLKRSLERQSQALDDLRSRRAALQARLDAAKLQHESEYLHRVRRTEGELGAVSERIQFLHRVKEMPVEIERRRRQADELTIRIGELQREIDEEEARLEAGRENVRVLEENFHRILRAIHFPEITEDDAVLINRRTWMPYIYPKGREDRAWSFGDAGSGGKMVLFKISFALAIHLTAAQRNLPVPRFLMIDSTMKNITPDVNPEIFEKFYTEMYRLLGSSLEEWQVVLIDQTFSPPLEPFGGFVCRKLTTSDPAHPPLISYYRGH